MAHTKVDMLRLPFSQATQTAGVRREQRAEDFAMPRAQQPSGHLDRAAVDERAKVHEQVGQPVDAYVPGLLRGMSDRTEERRLVVVAESTKRRTVARGHRTGL